MRAGSLPVIASSPGGVWCLQCVYRVVNAEMTDARDFHSVTPRIAKTTATAVRRGDHAQAFM